MTPHFSRHDLSGERFIPDFETARDAVGSCLEQWIQALRILRRGYVNDNLARNVLHTNALINCLENALTRLELGLVVEQGATRDLDAVGAFFLQDRIFDDLGDIVRRRIFQLLSFRF